MGEVLSSSAACNCVPLELYSRCIRDVFLSRSYSTGLREVSVQRTRLITASLLQLLLESVNGALVALLKILSRCHGDPTSYLLRFYQNAEDEPSNGVLSDPSATIQDVAALLRRCWRMCGAQLVGLDF